MSTITKVIPSGSTDGAPVNITATATAGTLFHTADASAKDEIYLFLANTSASDVLVTIEFGNATAPGSNIKVTAPANDVILVIAGVPLTNSKTVKAFAATTAVINMVGYVNRIS